MYDRSSDELKDTINFKGMTAEDTRLMHEFARALDLLCERNKGWSYKITYTPEENVPKI